MAARDPAASRRAERVLLVAPVGAVPWVSLARIAEAFRGIGCEVLVDDPGRGESLVGRPPVYLRTDSLAVVAAARYARSALTWWWRARRTLAKERIDYVVVWHTSLAGLMRLVRPGRAQLVWVLPDTRPLTRRGRLHRLMTMAAVDRLVVRGPGATRFFRNRHAVVPVPLTVSSDPIEPGGWAVLARSATCDRETVQLVAEQARQHTPAVAVVVDGRQPGHLFREPIEEVREASRAPEVVIAIDDGLWRRLGVSTVVDVGPIFTDDHRHWTALAEGVDVLVCPKVPLWALDPRLRVSSRADGMAKVAVDPDVSGQVRTLQEWCQLVLAPPSANAS